MNEDRVPSTALRIASCALPDRPFGPARRSPLGRKDVFVQRFVSAAFRQRSHVGPRPAPSEPLELRKLYEGKPSRIIRHLNAHAVVPDQELLDLETRAIPNVAIRTKALIDLVVRLGEALAVRSAAVELAARPGAGFTGLDRAWLDYKGWWNNTHAEPVPRHIPFGAEMA